MILDGKEQICQYIPQRDPIVMVDRLYDFSETASRTGKTVTADNIFVRDGLLEDGAILEHIAQSGALHIGYDCVLHGKPVAIGLIGSINKMQVLRRPAVGEEMTTDITIEAQVGQVTLIGAVTRVGDEVIAQGKMKVALEEN